MLARDLMRRDVLTVGEEDPVQDVLDLLIREHIHGAPVVGRDGELVGMVTQQDIYFSELTGAERGTETASLRVADIMTSPAVSASEETEISRLCQMMYKLRIHRVPILDQGKVTGIISSLDVCGAVSRGEKLD